MIQIIQNSSDYFDSQSMKQNYFYYAVRGSHLRSKPLNYEMLMIIYLIDDMSHIALYRRLKGSD